ncbi:unnamed protein product [Ixodes pacificus]
MQQRCCASAYAIFTSSTISLNGGIQQAVFGSVAEVISHKVFEAHPNMLTSARDESQKWNAPVLPCLGTFTQNLISKWDIEDSVGTLPCFRLELLAGIPLCSSEGIVYSAA